METFMATGSSILINTCGGLGIFLLGMSHLSEGLQAVAGKRIRRIVAAITSNKLIGIITGSIATAIVQSSSVVTVMIVGLVTAGLMNLQQAINVIIGSNIGTTITGWIVAIAPTKLGSHYMLIVAFAALIYLFAKKEKVRFLALACLGLGLIFFGLDLMSAGMKPLRNDPSFLVWFERFSAVDIVGVLKCVFVGAILTGILQSSSATIAIIISLAYNGVITFESATAFSLGAGIGTTFTAWLAAIGAPVEARRAALAHTLFNGIGAIIIIPLMLPFFIPLMHKVFPKIAIPTTTASGEVFTDVMIPIAAFFTGFKVIITIIFFPLLGVFAKIVTFFLPDNKDKLTLESVTRLPKLDNRRIVPVLAVEQVRLEVIQMADSAHQMLDNFRVILAGESDEKLEQSIIDDEDRLDKIQHEVSSYLGKIMATHLPTEIAYRARMLLRVADEYESVSDEVRALLGMIQRMRKNNMSLSDDDQIELLQLHDQCRRFADTVTLAFSRSSSQAPDLLLHMHSDAKEISQRVKDVRSAQLMRLTDHDPNAHPINVVLLMDMLNVYRRLKGDYLNIGEALIDERGEAQPTFT